MSKLKPTIYVDCYTCYEAGYLHQKSIDALQSADSLYNNINAMFADCQSTKKKWIVEGHSGFSRSDAFHTFYIHESTPLEEISVLAHCLAGHEELAIGALSHIPGHLKYAEQFLALLRTSNNLKDTQQLLASLYQNKCPSEAWECNIPVTNFIFISISLSALSIRPPTDQNIRIMH